MRVTRGGSLRRLLLAGATAIGVATACTPAPAGNPADFSVNVFSGWVQRWNPCVPVHYRVNDALNPGALANAKSAVSRLSAATGITFIFDGTTSFVPSSGNWSSPAPLIVAFAHHNGQPGGTNYLAGGNQLGEGGFQSAYTTVNGHITSYKIIKGYAVIDNDGYNRSSVHVRMAALLHELGHAVGLNHARFTAEIMYPVVSNSGPSGYAAGDLAGLRKVGRPSGCLA